MESTGKAHAMPAVKKTEPPKKMNFDEFMEWYEHQEGRWELHDGIPVRRHDPSKGQAERFRHVRAKSQIFMALRAAVEKAGLDCEVVADGATVRIDEQVSYEPDALIYCGERVDGNALEAPDPVIIVEVLSPSTAYKDIGDKLEDYFKLPSLAHYLIIDPKHGRITHHYREGEQTVQRAVHEKQLELNPPGLVVELTELRS